MSRRRWIVVLAVAIVLLTAISIAVNIYISHRDEPTSALLAMIRPERRPLFTAVKRNVSDYRSNSTRWSFAYFGCTFGSAVLGAFAGVILKLDALAARDVLRKDLASIFAAVAALLITLSTTGDFEQKWRANRIAASQMENIAYELSDPATKYEDVVGEIAEINEARNDAIVAKEQKKSGK